MSNTKSNLILAPGEESQGGETKDCPGPGYVPGGGAAPDMECIVSGHTTGVERLVG
mgnify:CR=1 FL=1